MVFVYPKRDYSYSVNCCVGFGPLCCKDCWLAFEQMLRLQQAIELMQQVDKLKAAVKSSVPSDYEEDPLKIPPDDILGKIKRSTCFMCSKLQQPIIFNRFIIVLKKGKEYQPCSVVLDRLSVDQLNILPKREPEETTLNADGCGLSIRKSKLKAFEFIENNSNPQQKKSAPSPAIVKDDQCNFNDEDYVPSPEAASPSQSDPDDDDEEEEYPWESEVKPIPETLPKQIDSICGTFSLISPDTLLYQYTLIKVSQGYTHFTCQEPECPSPHFSDLSLNWNSLFNQIANHIEDVHSAPASPKDGPGRKCPLCPAILTSGSQFRAHLISTVQKHEGHRIETVTCEICWRHIRNMSDAYKCHLWHHKNDQEKEGCPEGPPSTIVSKARNNVKLKRRLEKMLEKSGKLALIAEKRIIVPKPKKKAVMKSNFQKKLKQFKLKKQSCPSAGAGQPRRIVEHFSRILENSKGILLLYKFTLLKASYGVSLTCQEPNCDHVINGTDFTAFEEFKNHVKNCHHTRKSETSWECPLCSEELQTCFSFRSHLLCHCSAVSSSEPNYNCPFICSVCWRPMPDATQLDYHEWLRKSEIEKELVLNNKERPPPTLVQIKEKERRSQLKCQHCQREFKFLVTLKAHEATHLPKEERKKYTCSQCPRLFLSAVAVRGHVEREHQRELMRLRTCPICSKQYNWRDGYKFRSHLKSHRNERDFVCENCGMSFLNSMALKRHRERVHEGKGEEMPWQCEFCEMNYKESKHLKRHRRIAHKDKVREEMTEDEEQQRLMFTLPEYRPDFIGPKIAFPCPVCEKTFHLKSRMKKHWEKTCRNKL